MSNLLKIDKRFIENNAVDGDKILFSVGQTLRGLNSENQEIDLLAKLLEDATSYADAQIAALVGDSPELLDTLKELADAINNDPEFFSTISTLISTLEGRVDQEILDRQAGDAATLSDAKAYTDAQIAAIPAVDLSNYETIANVDSKDAQVLADAQSYADSAVEAEALARETVDNLIRSEIDDANAAIIAGDSATLSSAQAYTDAQIAAIPEVDLSGIQSDITALQSADSVLDGKIEAEKARVDAILLASDADKDSFAEIVQLINSVDTENDQAFASYVLSNDAALAQEVADRQAADADLQSQIDDLEIAANAKEVIEVESISSLSSGQAELIYVDKSDDKIYRWGDLVEEGEYDFLVGTGGDFANIESALASAEVTDGSIIKIQNGTYDLSSQLVINKQVKIYGESQDGVVLQSSNDTFAPVVFISITASDVALMQLTVKHRKSNNTAVESAIQVSGANCIVAGCRIEYMEFGITTNNAANFSFDANRMVHAGALTNSNRAVGVYGMSDKGFVTNCLFDRNGTTGSYVPVFIADSPTSGKLVVAGNQSVDTVFQFVVFTGNLTGAEGSFDLVVKDNVINETSAIILVTANTTKVINSITVADNTFSHRHTPTGGGKGLVTFYANGGDWGSIDLHISNNTVTDSFFRSGYDLFSQLKDSLGNPITTGIDAGKETSSVEPTIDVTVDSEIAPLPIQPSNPDILGGLIQAFIELSATDLSPLDTRLTAIENDLAIEVSNRIAADAQVLVDAKAYTDAQIAAIPEVDLSEVEADIAALEGLQADYLKIDGSRPMGADLNMFDGSTHHKIVGLADPVAARDAATKQYVDAVAEGLSIKPQVIAATTSNLVGTYDNGLAGVGATINLGPLAELSIDGVTSWYQYAGVLVKNQSNTFENGRYFVSQVGDASTDWILTRCGFCDTAQEIPSAYVFVQQGSQSGTGWVALVGTSLGADPNQFEVGSDAITWVQFSGAGAYTAGNALDLVGGEFNVKVDENTITINSENKLVVKQSLLDTIATNISEGDDQTLANANSYTDSEISGLNAIVSGSQNTLFEDMSSVYADGQAGVKDPTGRDGWYFKSAGGGNKVNWYFLDGTATPMTVGQLSNLYTIATVDSLSNDTFHLAYYTVRQEDGQDAGAWYRSKQVFVPVLPFERGVKTLFYVGNEPDASLHPELPRVQMQLTGVGGISVGPNDPSEQLLTAVFGTNSGASVDTIQLVANRLGIISSVLEVEYDLAIRSDFTLSGIKGLLLNEAIFREQSDLALEARIDALENAPVEFIFEEDIRFDISSELSYIELPHLAKAVFKVSVNRLNAFKGTDYTVSEVGGVTRITWAGDFIQPSGELALKAGDVVHVTYAR